MSLSLSVIILEHTVVLTCQRFYVFIQSLSLVRCDAGLMLVNLTPCQWSEVEPVISCLPASLSVSLPVCSRSALLLMAPNENQPWDPLSWPNKPFLSFFRCSAAGMQHTAVITVGGCFWVSGQLQGQCWADTDTGGRFKGDIKRQPKSFCF